MRRHAVQALQRVSARARACAGLPETPGVRVLLHHFVGYASSYDRLGPSGRIEKSA
jgi:hypothetical protein